MIFEAGTDRTVQYVRCCFDKSEVFVKIIMGVDRKEELFVVL
jgi:hypothetical protein